MKQSIQLYDIENINVEFYNMLFIGNISISNIKKDSSLKLIDEDSFMYTRLKKIVIPSFIILILKL